MRSFPANHAGLKDLAVKIVQMSSGDISPGAKPLVRRLPAQWLTSGEKSLCRNDNNSDDEW
jgi:hypothetical protein